MICWNKVLLFKISLMKIKNLKYILWLLFWSLLICNIAFSDCSDDMSSWSRPNPSTCQWTDLWFDNHNPNSDNVNLFLKIIDKSRNDCNASQVRAIQTIMQNTIWWNCSTCIDWRYWHHTEAAIASCLTMVCNTNWKQIPILNNWVLACWPGYEITNEDGIYCCTQVNVGAPTITAEPNRYDPYNPWEINVTVSFTDNSLPPFMWWLWINPTVQWWNIIAQSFTSYSKITFKITQPFDPSSIKITIPEWQLLYTWRIKSKEATLNLQAKECDKPASWWSCNAYWPSYTLLGSCCATNCSKPQNTWWNCDAWYRVEWNCCVVDVCQTPPISWSTDCTNQFWWRWVYNGAIQCCVDSGSCTNPPASPWQCSWNLVLDSAGQCCITCANPADSSWNCQSWYTLQWSCCFADNMCGEDQINQWWQCKACEEEWTKPNEPHTRCICDPDKKCCGVQLNNVVPFIWDCIEMNAESSRDNTTNVNSVTAFPILMQWLMKILMSVIMIFSFLMIIVAWLMIVSWAFGWNWFATGKKIIKNVIISLILLWCSWLILSLINPSFFGG